jgi:phosphoglycolate phosphatase
MPYKAVVFDLDGTLVESYIDYEKMGEEIKKLLTRMGMREHIEDRRKAYMVTRKGAESLLEYGLPPENLETTLRELNTLMNEIELSALPTMSLKPNVDKTLNKLHGSGFRLGITTRSHGEYATQSLKKFNIIHFFHGIIGRDETPYPKPDPRHLLSTINLIEANPEETLYIGDTTTDLATSLAANVDFVGYWRDDQWGQRLIDGGCKKIIKDLYHIVKLAGI